MKRISVRTNSRIELQNITSKVEDIVIDSGVEEGVCFIFTPHTTAAITINENADPSVVKDIITETTRLVPESDRFSHVEGNSPAHVKSSLIGASEIVFIENGSLVLGTWQGIFFCEFDGPRMRDIWVKVIPAWV